MFGTSNALHYFEGEEFRYRYHNFFESTSFRYFAITEEEVVETIDKLFAVEEKQKKKIKSNIDAWYNGYYRGKHSKLYQIYSTTQYIEDCYKEYKKRGISSDETDDKWIPSPMPYSVSSETAYLCNDYLSKGFSGECYDSLLDLYRGESVSYRDNADYHHPFLQNPKNKCDKTDIIFSLLIHGGYLTRCHEYKNIVKIPNCEVLFAFEQKLKEHLNSIPIQKKVILSLSKAVTAEDFELFGKELTKSVSKLILNKKKSYPPKLQYIHSLMWKTFGDLNSNSGNEDDSNVCTKLGSIRSKMDFHFKLAETGEKTHYIIQLDELNYDRLNKIEDLALERLKSVFQLNYHQHILEVGEAATIVIMGMAIHKNRVCLATLKVGIANGRITNATSIKHQRFWMDGNVKHSPQVNLTEQREYSINIPEIELKANLNATEKENTELYNKEINQVFATEIDSIREEAKKSGLKVESNEKKKNVTQKREPRSNKSKDAKV
jgi:hypothetical protein